MLFFFLGVPITVLEFILTNFVLTLNRKQSTNCISVLKEFGWGLILMVPWMPRKQNSSAAYSQTSMISI